MCAEKHASLGICVWGNNKLGETRIPATPVTISYMEWNAWFCEIPLYSMEYLKNKLRQLSTLDMVF